MIKRCSSLLILLVFIIAQCFGQETQEFSASTFEKNNQYSYSLGNGILFNFDDSTYLFKIGGMAQPRFLHTRYDDSAFNSENFFGVKRAYFNIEGSLNNGLVSFLIQTNFSDTYPLLDVWAGYHPTKNREACNGWRNRPRCCGDFKKRISL